MDFVKQLLVGFLVINALFWGLFGHHTHCEVAALAGIKTCPPHWMHIGVGVVSFLGAVVVAQWDYLIRLP